MNPQLVKIQLPPAGQISLSVDMPVVPVRTYAYPDIRT
jgi:hypothetical protein